MRLECRKFIYKSVTVTSDWELVVPTNIFNVAIKGLGLVVGQAMAGSIIGCSLQVWRNDSEAVSRILIRPRDKHPVITYHCQASTPAIDLTLTANKSLSVDCEFAAVRQINFYFPELGSL